jgi:hypothetical protein
MTPELQKIHKNHIWYENNSKCFEGIISSMVFCPLYLQTSTSEITVAASAMQ